jgi:aspartate/methionine/tyrosine aminotransferase
MKIETFEMERMQSLWENRVDLNLSESGVAPMSVGDLLESDELRDRFNRIALGYPQTNGTPELRRAIAGLYSGATEDHVLVTNGTAEANFLAAWTVVEPGDEVVILQPNYQQLQGIIRSFGAKVTSVWLRAEDRWRPDLDALEKAITPATKMVAVCNPNNPTGGVLTTEEMNRIAAAAKKADAWLLADEVYRGAELKGDITPSFWNQYEKTIVNCGLSKAYGLPGLRIGWMTSTPELIAKAWAYHDYTTICPTMTSDFLAQEALRPERREKILERTRTILRKNFSILQEWVKSHEDRFTMIAPEAAAIALLGYNFDTPSQELTDQLREKESLLMVPGAQFGMENYLRVGFGYDGEALQKGLERLSRFLQS